MKVCVIGDPHGEMDKIRRIKLKDTDLILLTGDIGKADLARKFHFENINRVKAGLSELEKTAEHVKAVHEQVSDSTLDVLRYLSKAAPVYLLQGNVGIPNVSEVRKLKEKYNLKLDCTRDLIENMPDVEIVRNRLRVLDGLRVGFLKYFSDVSWVKEFKPNDYADSMRRAKKQSALAKRVLSRFTNLDILLCHQPPYGVLDKVNFKGAPKHWQNKHAGSKVVLDYIQRFHPPYVCCGHIHEAEGRRKIGKTQVYNLGVAGHVFLDF